MFSKLKDYICRSKNSYLFPYEKKDGVYYPTITLSYSSVDGYKIQTKALVDSGADITLVPKSIGTTMGLSRTSLHYVGGVGGKMGYYLNSIELEICDTKVITPVAWATQDSIPFLLGRKVIFSKFKFCFSDKTNVTTVYV